MGANNEFEQKTSGADSGASGKAPFDAPPLGRTDQQVDRVTGRRAELATLQAHLRAARERGDIEQERAAATKLARRLVELGMHLDQATRLARRSLLLGEDPRLREQLSSWFAGLGRLALAAGTLEPLLDRQLSGPERARLWTRIAVLRARAGEAEASADALNQAARADRSDPLALELFAATRAFAPQAVGQQQATEALIQAANLRDAAGDQRAALEDLLQALNVNPGHLPAAERMARHLTSVGRPQAADEVWRRAASTLGPRDERSHTLHLRRVREALDAQLPAVALGAALDLEADRELSAETIGDALDLINDGAGFVPIPTFDGLLHCLGLTDWLLARAWRVAQRSEPEACAELTIRCARVLSGPLGQRDQLPWILSECLVQVPGADAVFSALSDYANTVGDSAWVVDAIVALGRLRMDHPATHRRLEQLAFLSERELRDPSPGVWALELLAERAPLSEDLTELLHRLRERVEPLEVPSPDAWKSVSLPELRRLIDHLAQRPRLAEAYGRALAEMCERTPEGLRWLRLRERLLWSQGREAELQQLWRDELARGRIDRSTCRTALLRSFRRSGQAERTLHLMAEGIDEPNVEEAVHYVSTAGELGSDAERVQALELLAECAKPVVASVLWAYVSGLQMRRGATQEAVASAERACRADQHSARAFVACAEALGDAETRVAGLVFERASRLALPRVSWCQSLARIADVQNNPTQRLKWLRRWASLAPLDTRAANALLAELSRGNDAAALLAALEWSLGQPRPRQELLLAVCDATLRLVDLAPEHVGGFARRLIGVFGLADERLVHTLRAVAERAGDPGLSVAVIERQLVFAPGAKEQVALLLEAAECRVQAGEPDLAVDCLARALELGANSEELVRRLEDLPPRTTSDAYLQELTIRVAHLRQSSSPASKELELELALSYRDLASDRPLAMAQLLPRDWADEAELAQVWFERWVTVLGHAEAARHLHARLAGLAPAIKQRWLRAASLSSLQAGERAVAVELAFSALMLAPLQTDVLAVLESAIPEGDTDELERAYRIVEGGLLGTYGERALHYRAACEFERRGDRGKALAHAEAAFLAIPGNGIAFALMSRLAQALGKPERIAEVMRQASESAPDTDQRRYWLGHATSVALDRAAQLQERVDVLLRALSVRADADAVDQVAALCAEIFELTPEARQDFAARFDGALRAALRSSEGPAGAKTALAAARFARGALQSPELLVSHLALAVELDPNEPGLVPWATELGATPMGPGSATYVPILKAVLRHVDAGRQVQVEMLRWCRQIAEDQERAALPSLAVALAVAQPHDVELLAAARKAAGNEAALLRRLEEAVPPLDRALAILRDVEGLDGAANQASRLDASVRRLASDTEWFSPVFERLRVLAENAEAQRQVESTLQYLVEQEDIGVTQRAEAARLLAELLSRRDSHVAALDVLARLAQWRQMSAADQRWGAEIARLAGDEEQELSFLGQWELRDKTDGSQNTSVEERVGVLARIAELHAAMGSRMQAKHYYERVLFLAPGDEVAARYLLEDAERTEDYSALAARLEEQLVTSRGEPAVAIRLAHLYAERLNSPERARNALENALRLYGDDEELLCALGELLDATGQDAAAAQVYQKASRGSRQHHRASHFAELACKSYLRAGLDASVKEILSVKGLYPNTQALAEMRVELARKYASGEELVVALEELSVVSKEPAAERAKYLLEASEVALNDLCDLERALALAERGARMSPNHQPLQLHARMLQYRKRGVGSRQEALYTITELRSMAPGRGEGPPSSRETGQWTAPVQAEVRAFLLSEALAKRSGAGSGLKELREVEERYGALPLVDLAIGERLAQSVSTTEQLEGLEHLERALNGEFRSLRNKDQVAFDAAVLALKLGHPERALALVARVDPRGDFGSSARELQSSIEASHPNVEARLFPEAIAGLAQRPAVAIGRVALKQVPANQARPWASGQRPDPVSEEYAGTTAPGTDLRSEEARVSLPEHTSEASADDGSSAEALPGHAPRRERELQRGREHGDARDEHGDAGDGHGDARDGHGDARDEHSDGQELPWPAAGSTFEEAPEPGVADPSGSSEAYLRVAAVTTDRGGVDAGPLPSSPSPEHNNVAGGVPWAVPAPYEHSDPFAAAKDELQRLESHPPTGAPGRHALVGRPVPPPKPQMARPSRPQALPLHAKAPPKRRADPTAPSVVVSRSVVIGPDPRARRADPLSQPPPSAQRSLEPNSELERGLMTALTAGSIGAGRELLAELSKDETRTRETLAVCRLLSHWAPGDEEILRQLRQAAQKDNDPVFARALLHVLKVVEEPGRCPVAPPLHRQSEHVDSMIKLLAGPIQAGCEALGVLWQHLPELFRQEPPEIAAERRIELSPSNPLGALVLELGRLFGCARVGVYESGEQGPLDFELVLGQPASLIISGDINPDAPHFRYHLGRMLFATRPEYALITGLASEELKTVLGAVGVGFGPPRRLAGDVSQIAHLAERFWELLPPHVQRRLGELCEQPQVLDADLVLEGARRALCRAGLFACGDLGVALREVGAAEGVAIEGKTLRALCEESEAMADLVRFATSLEYADARWRSGSSRSSAEELGAQPR